VGLDGGLGRDPAHWHRQPAAYGVYRPIDGGGMLPAYADHLPRTPLYAAEYQR
jgi:hypothetical protein